MGESTTIVPSESTEAPEKTLQTDCDDSPTRVTNSNTSSETASLPDEQEHQDALLSTLARQLEFYFSPSNLSRDTYLQTLQSLNDGYVPISIVANFAKVQVICSGQDQQVRTQAIIKAATSFTGVLEVVHISTVTNKKVAQEDENTILAVGPSTEPSSSSSSLLLSPKTPIQNTIILREVPEDVKDEDVRGLFEDNEACPPLQEVRLDVANCWFVTLDTTSRDDMMNVMMDLRKKTIKGEAVKARLKTAVTPTSSFVGSLDPSAISFPAIHSPPESPSRNRNKTKSKNKQGQKRSRRKNSNANKQQQQQQKQPPASPSTPKKQVQTKQVTAPPPLPPKLEEESHFPALATPSVAVDNIVDKVGVDKVAASGKTMSTADGASTATTASSATSSTATPVPPPGGYAAALLKAAPPKDETKTATSMNGSATKKSHGSKSTNDKLNEKSMKAPETVTVEKKEEPKEKITAMPMSWGSGRSFAQVLLKKEQSS